MMSAVVLVDFESIQDIDFSQLEGSRLVVFAGEIQKKVPIEVAMGLQALGERARWVRSSGIGPNALDFHIAFEIGRMVEKGEKGPVFVLSHDRGFDSLLTWLGTKLSIPARRVTALAEAFRAGPADTLATEGQASGPAQPSPTPAQPARGTPAPAASPMPNANANANAKPAAHTPPKAAKTASVKAPAKKAAQPHSGNDKKSSAKPNAELTRQILARSQKAARPRRRVTLAKHIHAMFKAHAIAEREVENIIAKLIANRSISDAEGAITYHF